MVTDLLDIARIESGEEIFNESAIDFDLILHEIKKTFSDIIKRRKGRLESHVADDIGRFRGDREKLKQLLINLVANSVNYSDNGCLIDIKVAREGDKIIIKTSDTGWGIPPEDIPHLTKKFYRGKHGIKSKGTGLGLSICKEIARLHGGSIDMISKVGKGTTVTVSLPWKN
jgi:signal transduction histidine kinase